MNESNNVGDGMRKYLFVMLSAILVVSSFGVILPKMAYACSCANNPDPKTALEKAEAVFVGKVIKVKQERKQQGVV